MTTASTRAAAPAGQGATIRPVLRIPHPRLWQGVKDPYLYRTIVILRSSTGAVLDRTSQPLGVRTVKFDADKGFFLNGEHLSLRGASMHQDRPVKGWAISRADQAEDFDLLADMGGNAVRLAHYQHDQYSYELADARGIVAWAEIPLVNEVHVTPERTLLCVALVLGEATMLHEVPSHRSMRVREVLPPS